MQQVTQGTTSRPCASSRLQSSTYGAPACRTLPHQERRIHRVRSAATDRADGSSNGATGATNPLDFEELTELIRMVHDTDIVELELKSKKFSLSMKKKEAVERPEPIYQAAPAPAPSLPPPPPQAAAPASPQPAAPATPSPSSGPPSSNNGAGSAGNTVEVASPMSGTFYHSPAPGEPPFVKVGDKVTKGQTIGIIEAMKLMNEIEADASGTIVDFIAENKSSVAPGQGLVRIQP